MGATPSVPCRQHAGSGVQARRPTILGLEAQARYAFTDGIRVRYFRLRWEAVVGLVTNREYTGRRPAASSAACSRGQLPDRQPRVSRWSRCSIA